MDFKERWMLLELADDFCNSNCQQCAFCNDRFTCAKFYNICANEMNCRCVKNRLYAKMNSVIDSKHIQSL